MSVISILCTLLQQLGCLPDVLSAVSDATINCPGLAIACYYYPYLSKESKAFRKLIFNVTWLQVFVLFSTILTTLLEVIALAAIRDPTSSGIALSPGPYGLIFASFIPFFFDIPISTRFRVFGATFSDKSFIYLAGLQLLLSSWKRSLIPGICGILAGFTYRSNVLRLRRMKFPDSLASATATLFRPLLSSVASSPAVPAGRPAGTREAANQTQMGRPYEGRFAATAPPLAPMAPPPPPEESVSTLVAMGFDRNLAVQALTRSRNDVMMATNLLLESQTH
ncbi:hypothetical protein AXG93_872s1310 [Marchantia polymorpha subsp. ruderalis]|uniref:UBA domain-containing protein n=1 Tax=Marchantia polymorpha subsp. ruderalis TaxID=1480154 RepID=A0A176VLG1_MARPO|nr:hypothetical protein AXG93_872s1310 [Marchantia polymorpha subsp. ruderalis]